MRESFIAKHRAARYQFRDGRDAQLKRYRRPPDAVATLDRKPHSRTDFLNLGVYARSVSSRVFWFSGDKGTLK